MLGRAQQCGLERRVLHEDEREGYVLAPQSLIFLKNSLLILLAILARLSANDHRFTIEFPYALARHALEILIKVKDADCGPGYQFPQAINFTGQRPSYRCPYTPAPANRLGLFLLGGPVCLEV